MLNDATRIADQPFHRMLGAAAVVSACVVFGVMAVPMLRGEVYSILDLWEFYLPYRDFYAQCLSSGESPLWFPGFFCGFYLHGAGSVGMFHPLHWLLYRGLPITVAFDLEVLLPYPLMYLGTHLFLRRLKFSTSAALFGALLFAFSTFNIARLNAPNAILMLAHLPYLLCLLDVLARTTSIRSALWSAWGVAVLTASELLLGYPQYFWFTSLGCAAYIAYLFWDRAMRFQRLALFALAIGIGIAAAGVQLLPTFDANAESHRTLSPEWSDDNRNAGSTTPRYMLQLFSGYTINPSHKQRPYAGAVVLLLFFWTVATFRGSVDQRRLFWAAITMVILAAWLCLGQYGVLYELQAFVPMAGKFRFPSRYVHLMSLGLTLVCVLGFEQLAQHAQRRTASEGRRYGDLAVLGGVVLSFAVTAVAFATRAQQVQENPLRVALGFVIFLVAGVLIMAAARGFRWAVVLLPLLAAADAGYYSIGYAIWGNTSNIQARLAADRFPDDSTDTRFYGGDFASTIAGRSRADGVDGLSPYQRLQYGDLNSLRASSVGWVFPPNPSSPDAPVWNGPPIAPRILDVLPQLQSAENGWYRVPNPVAYARLVTSTVVSTDPDRDIGTIDVATTSLVTEPVDIESGTVGTVSILERRPGRLVLDTETPGRQLLIVAERWHTGWNVQIDDGAVTAPLRVNGDFMGCVVEPGLHRVSMHFEPASFELGKLLSLYACGGLLVFALTVSLWPHKHATAGNP